MKLSITVQDTRAKWNRYGTSETEEYDRVSVLDLEGNGAIVAGVLRAIADDIDPHSIPNSFGPTAIDMGGLS